MRVARIIFRVAGVYGLIVLTPLFFLGAKVATETPGGLTHPEYYYGFVGAAWVLQLVYLLISSDPRRYRPLMPLAMLAKLSFFIPVLLLWRAGRTGSTMMGFACVDLLLALAFLLAWQRTPRDS